MTPPSEKKKPAVVIFADGASSGNPGPGGWGAIIAYPEGKILELGGAKSPTTNNQMELIGVIRALVQLEGVLDPIEIYTDSTYVIRGITQWIWGWRKKGWKTAEGKDVVNQDLWKTLSSLVTGKKISWHHVRGHAGVPGNERVDTIAVEYSKGRKPALYSGPLLKYDVAIYDIPENTDLPEPKPVEKGPKPKAYSYLSLLGNTPMRHKTWAECEARVKGRPGAKFKKAMDSAEEVAILTSWGYGVSDISGEF